MADWKSEAKRDWPLGSSDAWDGDAAKAALFTKYGFDGDKPDHAVSRCFLFVDADKRDEKGSYKCPFCDVIDGDVKAMPGGLSQCRTRIDGTDCGDAKGDGQAVLDAYAAREGKDDDAEDEKAMSKCDKCGGELSADGKCEACAKCDTLADDADGDKSQPVVRRKGYTTASAATSIDKVARTAVFCISSGALDRDSEVLNPAGANFKSYLATNPTIFWNHDGKNYPVGTTLDIWQDADGKTWAKGHWPEIGDDKAKSLQDACHSCWAAIENGLVKACSVGFNALETSRRKCHKDQKGETIEKWELLEWSPCPIGSNPEALVKGLEAGMTNKALRALDPQAFDELLANADVYELARIKGSSNRAAEVVKRAMAMYRAGLKLDESDAARCKGAIQDVVNIVNARAKRATANADEERRPMVKAYIACIAVRGTAIHETIDTAAKLGLLTSLCFISDEDLEWDIGMDVDGDGEVYKYDEEAKPMPGIDADVMADDDKSLQAAPGQPHANGARQKSETALTPSPEDPGALSDGGDQARVEQPRSAIAVLKALAARAPDIIAAHTKAVRDEIGG